MTTLLALKSAVLSVAMNLLLLPVALVLLAFVAGREMMARRG